MTIRVVRAVWRGAGSSMKANRKGGRAGTELFNREYSNGLSTDVSLIEEKTDAEVSFVNKPPNQPQRDSGVLI